MSRCFAETDPSRLIKLHLVPVYSPRTVRTVLLLYNPRITPLVTRTESPPIGPDEAAPSPLLPDAAPRRAAPSSDFALHDLLDQRAVEEGLYLDDLRLGVFGVVKLEHPAVPTIHRNESSAGLTSTRIVLSCALAQARIVQYSHCTRARG